MNIAGAAGSGGATGFVGAAGEAGVASTPAMPTVSPEESAKWTWSRCGTIPSSSPAVSAALSFDDRHVAVLDYAGAITVYDLQGVEPTSVLLNVGAVSALAIAPRGTILSITGNGTTNLVEYEHGVGYPGLEQSSGEPCSSEVTGFSSDGKYVFSYGSDEPACIWSTSDGSLFPRPPFPTVTMAVAGETVISVEPGATASQIAIVTRDLTGAQLASQLLDVSEPESVQLSPAGDRLVALGSPARLIDVSTGADVVSRDTTAYSVSFDSKGDLVCFSDGVFETATGTRVRDVPSVDPAWALTSDGAAQLVTSWGNASLRRVDTGGFVRVFGAPAQRQDSSVQAADLAISADGSLLVLQGLSWVSYGLRVAENFEASSLAWSAFAGDAPSISDLSADGKWLAVSGDNRVLVDTSDGHVRWPAIPPESTRCAGSQLRFSTSGKWAAGDSYQKTIDVFETAASETAFPAPLVSLPAAGCIDALAFSRDEQLMATSGPELYTTGDHESDWKLRWSARVTPDRAPQGDLESEVRFSPDQQTLLVSHCEGGGGCSAELHALSDGSVIRPLPELTAPHPAFSSEGDWLVSGPTLLHLPSGRTVTLDPLSPERTITTAIFAPNGDIIAGADDLSVTRYCRNQ